jgi:hypothetical protein
MRVKIENDILILHFDGNRNKMNEVLDPLSNAYEGILVNREGHNFPVEFIPKNHILSKYKKECKYVIGIYNGKSIQHELLHAKYYIDIEYRNRIDCEWNELCIKKRMHIIQFLKRLGYSDDVLIDEYQAYRYTEAPNFFGIRLE